MSDDPSFLSRWSKRKRANVDEVEQQKLAAEARDRAGAGDQSPPTPEMSEEEALEKFDLKDPDEMEPGDDFSGFMKSAIPEKLRNRALRKLWLSDPSFSFVDELLEYGEDYTEAASIVEDIVTAYKVGKGYAKDPVEEEATLVDSQSESNSGLRAETPDAADPQQEDTDEAEAAHSDDHPDGLFDEEDPASESVAYSDVNEVQLEQENRAPTRRMKFSFTENS